MDIAFADDFGFVLDIERRRNRMEMMDMAADDTLKNCAGSCAATLTVGSSAKTWMLKIKEGANVPVYVLEFKRQYCSSNMRQSLSRAFNVKRILADNLSARMRLKKFSPSCARTGAIPLLIW